MEYYSSLKRKEILMHVPHAEPGSHCTQGGRPNTKQQALSDTVSGRSLESSNSQTQKAAWGSWGLLVFMGTEVPFRKITKF